MKKRILLLLLSLVLAFSQLPLVEAHAEEYPQLVYDEMEDLQDIYDLSDNTDNIKHIIIEPDSETTFEDSYYEFSVEEEGYLFFAQYDKFDNRFWSVNGIDDDRSLITSVYTGKSLTSSIPRKTHEIDVNYQARWQVVIYEAYYLLPGTYYVGACFHRPNGSGNSFRKNGQESILYAGFLASSKVFSVDSINYLNPSNRASYAEVRFNYPANNWMQIVAAPEVSARNEQDLASIIGGSSTRVEANIKYDDEAKLIIYKNGIYTARYIPSTAIFVRSKIPFYTQFTIDRIGNPIVPEKLTLSDSSITLKKGDTYKLTAEISPSDAIDQTLKWKSSSTKVCRVKKGVLTAKSEGTCKITVTTSNGIKKTCKVTVVAKDSGSDSKKSDTSVKTTPTPTPKDKEDSKSSSTPESTKSTEPTPDPNGSGFYDQDIWDIDRIINVAIQEVGYIEKTKYDTDLYDKDSKNNDKKGKGNWVKYARDFDISVNYACNNDAANGHHPEWCSVFVWWCAYQAGLVDSGVFPQGKYQSGSQPIFAASYFPKNFEKVNDPQPGDIVWYDFKDDGKTTYSHVGLIVAVDKNYIYTVEGNTSAGKGDKKSDYYYDFGKKVNSDAPAVVQAKARKKTYSSIGGYVRPKYGTYTSSSTVPPTASGSAGDKDKSGEMSKTGKTGDSGSKSSGNILDAFGLGILNKLPFSSNYVEYAERLSNGFELKNKNSGRMLNLYHGDKKGGTDDGNKFDTYPRDNSETERFQLIYSSDSGVQLRNYCSKDKYIDVTTNGRGVPKEGDAVALYKPTNDGCSYWKINYQGNDDEGVYVNIESMKTPGLYIGHPDNDLDGKGRKGLVLCTDGSSDRCLWYIYDPDAKGIRMGDTSTDTNSEKDSSGSSSGMNHGGGGKHVDKADAVEKRDQTESDNSLGVGLLGPDGKFKDSLLGDLGATILDDSKSENNANNDKGKQKTDVEKIIEIAIGEIGYIEKTDNNNLDQKDSLNNDKDGINNWTKYSRDYYLSMNKKSIQTHEWCSLFIWWCGYKAGLVEKGIFPEAGTEGLLSAKGFAEKFTKVDKPQRGDIVYYNFGHVGLVVDVDKEFIYTVEGNTGKGSGDAEGPYYFTFGDKVNKKYTTIDKEGKEEEKDVGAVVQYKKKKRTNNKIVGYYRPEYNN